MHLYTCLVTWKSQIDNSRERVEEAGVDGGMRRPLIGHPSSPELRARGGTRLLGASARQQGTVTALLCEFGLGAVTHLSVRAPLAAGPAIPPGEARCAAAPWAFGSADLVT